MSDISLSFLSKQIRFVLVEPSHPGNIGSVARAIKTMGLTNLVIVNPKCAVDAPEAIALASGADNVLLNSTVTSNLSEALEGVHYSVALSSRLREYGPPSMPIRIAVDHALSHLQEGQIAFVFGSERTGLLNEHLQSCQIAAYIPTSTEYQSLNLAQAAQIVAYELLQKILCSKVIEPAAVKDLATHNQIEGMFAHFEEALIALDFLDKQNPKKLMARLRQLFSRTELSVDEVNIFRGIAKHILLKF